MAEEVFIRDMYKSQAGVKSFSLGFFYNVSANYTKIHLIFVGEI